MFEKWIKTIMTVSEEDHKKIYSKNICLWCFFFKIRLSKGSKCALRMVPRRYKAQQNLKIGEKKTIINIHKRRVLGVCG